MRTQSYLSELEITKKLLNRMQQIDYYRTNDKYTKHLEKQGENVFKKYVDEIIARTDKDSRILEVGCGTGIALNLLKLARENISGIDISTTSIATAKAKGLAGVSVYDGKTIPFNDDSFDLVSSFDVLEHADDPEHFLNESYRVLKPGGLLFVVCPNFLSITNNYHHHTRSVLQKGKNLVGIFQRLISKKHSFRKMAVIVRDDFHSDDDACAVTNPIDIRNWAHSKRMICLFWSGSGIYTSGLKKNLDIGFMKLFLGSSFLVFKKLEG